MSSSRFGAFLLPLLALGCGTPRSSYLDTAGFYVTYTVIHDEDSEPIALADFRDRGESGGALDLVDGDQATVDDVLMVPKDGALLPERDESFGYFARVVTAPAHRFSLLRDGESKTVHVVDEVPPPSATIDGSKRATAEAPAPVLVTWPKVPGTKISISIASDDRANCRTLELVPDADDPGFYVIDSKALRVDGSKASCSFVIRVTRRKESTIGAPFIGGTLRSIAASRVELVLR